jgi:hypothetical protein
MNKSKAIKQKEALQGVFDLKNDGSLFLSLSQNTSKKIKTVLSLCDKRRAFEKLTNK